MVFLNRIYTKSGDKGETSLGDGSRVPKTHLRILAYGGVDELNSVIGLALTQEMPSPVDRWLSHIQNDLFDLGADLCVPGDPEEENASALRVTAAQVTQLEQWIDEINEKLSPLTSFILPGGTPAAAHLHHARTICRRVEIGVVALSAQDGEPVTNAVLEYLNRLSDLLFVLARFCNDEGKADVLWVPGQNRTS